MEDDVVVDLGIDWVSFAGESKEYRAAWRRAQEKYLELEAVSHALEDSEFAIFAGQEIVPRNVGYSSVPTDKDPVSLARAIGKPVALYLKPSEIDLF